MVCYYCKQNTAVVNSRFQKRNNSVWRRRRCLSCRQVFTTIEKVDPGNLIMVESSVGYLEPFERDKLFISIISCLNHLESPVDTAKSLTDTVISKILLNNSKSIIKTREIKSIAFASIGRFDSLAAEQYNRSY